MYIYIYIFIYLCTEDITVEYSAGSYEVVQAAQVPPDTTTTSTTTNNDNGSFNNDNNHNANDNSNDHNKDNNSTNNTNIIISCGTVCVFWERWSVDASKASSLLFLPKP